MSNTELLNECINLWGDDLQKIIAMEECAELIQALSKDLRKNIPPKKCIDNISEEIADVLICIETLVIIYTKNNLNFNELVSNNINYKLDRLKIRLEAKK